MASNTRWFDLKRFQHLWLSSLLVIVIFLLPTNLFVHFLHDSAYVTGIFSDYLLVKAYASEITVWIYALSVVVSTQKLWIKRRLGLKMILKSKAGAILVFLLTAFVGRQLLSAYPLVGVWNLLEWLEVPVLFIALHDHWRLYGKEFTKVFRLALILTILFQSAIGLGQFFRQATWFGFRFFGEPSFGTALNLAKITAKGGAELILPYGTTAHPNLLGGYIAVLCSILVWIRSQAGGRSRSTIQFVTLITASIMVFFTHSLTAVATLIIGVFAKRLQPFQEKFNLKLLLFFAFLTTPLLLLPLVAAFPDFVSASRRLWLQLDAISMIQYNLVWGVGLGQFTAEVTNFTANPDVWRFLQPVHSAFWLLTSEIGLLGLTLGFSIWRLLRSSQQKIVVTTMLVLFAPLVFDHYLVTLQPGRWLLALTLFGLTLKKNINTSQKTQLHSKS